MEKSTWYYVAEDGFLYERDTYFVFEDKKQKIHWKIHGFFAVYDKDKKDIDIFEIVEFVKIK